MTAITMLDAIKMGAVKRPLPLCCPFCGADPGLARQSHGRFIVGCEGDECPACPEVSDTTLDGVWKKWNARHG